MQTGVVASPVNRSTVPSTFVYVRRVLLNTFKKRAFRCLINLCDNLQQHAKRDFISVAATVSQHSSPLNSVQLRTVQLRMHVSLSRSCRASNAKSNRYIDSPRKVPQQIVYISSTSIDDRRCRGYRCHHLDLSELAGKPLSQLLAFLCLSRYTKLEKWAGYGR